MKKILDTRFDKDKVTNIFINSYTTGGLKHGKNN